jgi:putative ABC transport system ATP-binding protein
MALDTAYDLSAGALPHAPAAVRLDRVTRIYGRGEGEVVGLDDVTLSITRGSFTAVMGPSGSGKSTFLHVAAGLDAPTSGAVRLGGVDVGRLREAARTALRRERVGFVFQAFNLLPSLTVEQNVGLPLRLSGRRPDRAWQREVIERVGLDGKLERRPAQLSGGQQQRVAIARALLTRPEVVFADEPTGALDTRTSGEILDLLRHVVDVFGQTVVMVTHDPLAAVCADRVLYLADGSIVAADEAPTAEAVAERMTHLEA